MRLHHLEIKFLPLTTTKIYSTLMLAGISILIAGCASTPAPTAQLAVSKAAVMNASNADTSQYAPVELRSAREKLIRAEQAMDGRNYELAEQLATEAAVDARLAESKTQAAKAQKAAQDSQEATGVLREEINRKAQ